MKGGGFFRRAASVFVGLGALVGAKAQPIVSTTSSMHATVPSGQSKAPQSQTTRSQQVRKQFRAYGGYRSQQSDRVIPPFKFCHGRTMVARYRAPVPWKAVG